MPPEIRPARSADLADVLRVERQAFGHPEGDVIVHLVQSLLRDPSAEPLLSLVAVEDAAVVGHVLFSHVSIAPAPAAVTAAILAPLAVLPEAQGQGIGGRLIEHGVRRLAASGVGLAFVLGYPAYYGRHGFVPAAALGFEAPFALDPAQAEAWRVRALDESILGNVAGRVVCADALNRPEYWRE